MKAAKKKGDTIPGKITPEVEQQFIGALMVGATEKLTCMLLGISTQAIRLHKTKHPDFKERVEAAKEIPDEKVQKKLYDRAMEGEFAAIRFWLMNRKRDEWTERSDINSTGDVTVTVVREKVAKKKVFNEEED